MATGIYTGNFTGRQIDDLLTSASRAIPTKLSDLTDDASHRFVSDTEKSTWNGKQDKLESGVSIKTINSQSLLGSGNITISGGSGGGGGDVNVIEAVKVNGTALTPDSNKAVDITSVPASIVTQDSTHRFVSDTEKSTWNGKQNALSNASVLSGITSAKVSSWDSASADKHTHSNKTVLDGISSNDITNWNDKTSNVGTITGINMNGASKGTSGVVDLGTVITSHQTIKTLNNQPLTGSGNITVAGLPTVSSSDNGKVLMVVGGAWTPSTPVSIYTGSSAPNNSQGIDGDIYIRTT